jgi:hypothetical protein
MAATTASITIRARRGVVALGRAAAWAVVVGLALAVAAELIFFVTHVAHLLSYPYPLDYGEGPLLAQVQLLLSGTPVWRLYADPGAPPYAVVNYPPVYHLLTVAVALALGSFGMAGGGGPGGAALQAGRVVSIAATLAAVVALWLLADHRPPTTDHRHSLRHGGERQETRDKRRQQYTLWSLVSGLWVSGLSSGRRSVVARTLVVLAFLGLPIVREWGALMRVDMLGLSLGLSGLVIVQRSVGRRGVLWAALPLTLSLFVKPSLIAAPAAALLWLLFRDWRRALLLGLLMAAGGGLAGGLLQLASGDWFVLHILAANVNAWQSDLARGFWHDQRAILWPLLAAAGLGLMARWAAGSRRPTTDHRPPTTGDWKPDPRSPTPDPRSLIPDPRSPTTLLPLYYTLFGALVALGVGKVGAYTNYFLEFYAGLVWLSAAAIRPPTTDHRPPTTDDGGVEPIDPGGQPIDPDGGPSVAALQRRYPLSSLLSPLSSLLIPLFIAGALLRYYPLWSETYLKPYGMIEQANPPRIAFGRYGVWRDLAREREVLAALGRINAALVDEVRAAGAPIFTDVPGVAAQAGQLARLQAFEHRQLLDAGQWDQRPLLRDLANGRVPLVALDYLGNWLTPEMIALITHRYAQDGSRGTYDLYRPVEVGPPAAADLAFSGGPRLVGYHLGMPAGGPIYQAGETLLLTLEWRRDPQTQAAAEYEVVAQLLDEQGNRLIERVRPLLYGALPPAGWGDAVMQHLQPLALPPELPDGTYRLAVTLRAGGRDLAAPHTLAPIVVAGRGGRLVGEQGYFVPAALFAVWQAAGGYDGPGDPLMPAVPFHDFTLQCFARVCLRIEGGVVQRLPLGELVYLGDAGAGTAVPPQAGDEQRFAETGQSLRGSFLDYWRASGGVQALGPPISGELLRGDTIVQYTRYARLERPVAGGEVHLGRLGEEFLRLPGGAPYRWP